MMALNPLYTEPHLYNPPELQLRELGLDHHSDPALHLLNHGGERSTPTQEIAHTDYEEDDPLEERKGEFQGVKDEEECADSGILGRNLRLFESSGNSSKNFLRPTPAASKKDTF
jgi:hypothetical protein